VLLPAFVYSEVMHFIGCIQINLAQVLPPINFSERRINLNRRKSADWEIGD
jgi:hypothetical protein